MSPAVGILEWFRPGEYAQVERVLSDLKAVGVRALRTGVSWADWHSPEGEDWYAWLLPRLAREVEVLPCFHYTPPSLGMVPKTSSPPRRPRDYADFIDRMITDFDPCFEWVELWNEPNNLCDWDWRLDPQWGIFCEMVGAAAYWAQQRGKKTLLAGMAPVDPYWLGLIADRGVLQYIDAVGLHGFPGTWEFHTLPWVQKVEQVQAVLDRYHLNSQIWITETGFSTWRHDEYSQLQCFVEAIAAPVERVYWYSCYDLHPDLPSQEGFHVDERHYHTGLKRQDGTAKLLYRIWASEGLESVADLAQMEVLGGLQKPAPSRVGLYEQSPPARAKIDGFTPPRLPVVILGGAGFIGTHLAHRLAREGQPVVIFDNLSRPGSEQNLRQLCETWGELVQVAIADLRDRYRLRYILQEACAVYHLASPPASPGGQPDPLGAFEVTASGTLYLLEELRSLTNPPPLIYTSTTAVYGPGEHPDGFREDHPLNVPTSDACAQSTAEQYAINYARSFGIPAIVLRLGSIYGPSLRGKADCPDRLFLGNRWRSRNWGGG